MVAFPNCKINIGLNILNKRPDGYHNLQTVFYPIAIKDVLEIIESHNSEKEIIFSCSGFPIDTKNAENICVKAFLLLKKDFSWLPAIKMHLHKNIPLGAGLGGGSADAAFALQLINQKFSLNLSEEQLLQYALSLGSDCPFFIKNKTCFGTGRGELLEPITLNLSNFNLLIVNPGIHINTAFAFSNLSVAHTETDLKKQVMQPVNTWKDNISNDFEKGIFKQYPDIAAIKATLYAAGVVYASMSGSGSTVYGIFHKEAKPIINFPEQYFCKWV